MGGILRKLFHPKDFHKCTIKKQHSYSYLPPLYDDPTCWERFVRIYKKSILIWDENPRSLEMYRTEHEIHRMRKKQVKSNTWHVVHPFSMLRAFYEVYMIPVYLFCMVYPPIDASFDTLLHGHDSYVEHHKATRQFGAILRVLVVATFIDIFMTFSTGYALPKKKLVVMNKKKIALNYLLSIYVLADVLPCFELINWFLKNYLTAIDLMQFFRLLRLPTLLSYSNRTAELFQCRNKRYKILVYGVVTILVMHWFACLFFLVPQFRYFIGVGLDGTSWIISSYIVFDGFVTQYLHSFYRATSFLLCIDGQVNAKKGEDQFEGMPPEELLMGVIVYIFGKILVSFLTVILLQMFLSTRNLETKYYQVMDQVNSYMRQNKLPIDMQKKLLTYYDFKFNKSFFKTDVISDLLSDKLMKEINLHVCKKLVQSVSLFAMLPTKLLEDVLSQLEAEIYLPNDIIIRSGTVGDCMYFLASGTVVVFSPSGKEACHLQDGAHFGEVSLVMKNKLRTATVVAIEICELYRLDRKVFRSCLGREPEVLKNLETIATERVEEIENIDIKHKAKLRTSL